MINNECNKEVDLNFIVPGKISIPCSAVAGGINYQDIFTLYELQIPPQPQDKYQIELPVASDYAYLFFGAINLNRYRCSNTCQLLLQQQTYDNNAQPLASQWHKPIMQEIQMP